MVHGPFNSGTATAADKLWLYVACAVWLDARSGWSRVAVNL